MTDSRTTDPLLPAERAALTLALSRVRRAETLSPNVVAICVLALARITGRYDYTNPEKSDDRPAS